jgi:hypothetical protein
MLIPWYPFIQCCVQSTAWVKRESELEASKQVVKQTSSGSSGANSWFSLKGGAQLQQQFKERLHNLQNDFNARKGQQHLGLRLPSFKMSSKM